MLFDTVLNNLSKEHEKKDRKCLEENVNSPIFTYLKLEQQLKRLELVMKFSRKLVEWAVEKKEPITLNNLGLIHKY